MKANCYQSSSSSKNRHQILWATNSGCCPLPFGWCCHYLPFANTKILQSPNIAVCCDELLRKLALSPHCPISASILAPLPIGAANSLGQFRRPLALIELLQIVPPPLLHEIEPRQFLPNFKGTAIFANACPLELFALVVESPGECQSAGRRSTQQQWWAMESHSKLPTGNVAPKGEMRRQSNGRLIGRKRWPTFHAQFCMLPPKRRFWKMPLG